MRDELLAYYERELALLRRRGAEFAEDYPKIASRLELESSRCADPHVERLIEAFAFLAARVHLKIDDEFPEITEALLNILYPHYLRPIPAMSIAEFHLNPQQGRLTSGLCIPRGTMLNYRYGTRALAEGTREEAADLAPCKFRTCYETTLWPITVTNAQWLRPEQLAPSRAADTAGVLRLELTCFAGSSFEELDLQSLRFHLSGEPFLYELLGARCTAILLRDPSADARSAPFELRPGMLRALGFAEDEATLPYPRRSFVGYRLLQEYFTFPDKFLFFDLYGLERLSKGGFKRKAEILFLISRFEPSDRQDILESSVNATSIRLGCAPIINLFPWYAEPVRVDHTRYEYPVVPDARRPHAFEIFSVDEVFSTGSGSHETTRLEPLYSSRHATTRREGQIFWQVARRPASRVTDKGTDVYLSLADGSSGTIDLGTQTLTVACTCTNRDWPSHLRFGRADGDFELEESSPVENVVALNPTPPLRPPIGKGSLWRLISHLSLNYLSLVEEGRDALQEMLRLYNFADSPSIEGQIIGITNVKSSLHFAQVPSEEALSFVRGRTVEIEFDEERFVGGNVYLFASVLERFLGLYVSMNSFSRLIARTRQRKEPVKTWLPRAGQAILM